MASVVNMCNSALNLLGASTISALTDDTKNAKLCNQRYEPVRNRVFRSHAWNCLHKRVQLAQNSTAPVVEYTYAYALPSDCLRSLKIHNGTTDSIASSIDYKLEGRNIWAIKVSDNPNIDEDEPEALYTGLHHAREPMSYMNLFYFMYWLGENYETDVLATHLVDNRELWFIPAINPCAALLYFSPAL